MLRPSPGRRLFIRSVKACARSKPKKWVLVLAPTGGVPVRPAIKSRMRPMIRRMIGG